LGYVRGEIGITVRVGIGWIIAVEMESGNSQAEYNIVQRK